jgi:hypothetical protein
MEEEKRNIGDVKNVIFVWIPIIIYMVFQAIPLFAIYPIPFEGAIILLGGSISGYTGLKAFGVYQSASSMPKGQGVSKVTKNKIMAILIALYVIIAEALIVQYIKPGIEIPLNDLFGMAGICSAVVLGGNQAIKSAEIKNGNSTV